MGLRKLKNNIGRKITNLRIDNDISQEKLAEFINMSREHISCIERGKNMPTIETLECVEWTETRIKFKMKLIMSSSVEWWRLEKFNNREFLRWEKVAELFYASERKNCK